MRRKLTDRFVQTVKPPAAGRLTITDTGAKGLTLRVTSKGEKSWLIRYRPKGGTQRSETPGSYPAMKLAAARSRALDIFAAARRGVDLPAREREERKQALRAAERPSTVEGLLEVYVERHCKPNQRRWKLIERLYQKHVIPRLGEKALAELRRADVIELLDDLQNKKGLRGQVDFVRSNLISALNWAVDREYLDANPAASVKRRKLVKDRERILGNDELRAIWRAAESLSDPGRSFVKALILTAARKNEVRCMPWAEVGDLDTGEAVTWWIPASRNKSGRDFRLPLSSPVVDLLKSLPRRGPYVFTITGEIPFDASRTKAEIDKKSGVSGWVYHDLRRTVRSGLAELRIPEEVAERILNHAQKGLSRVYNRHDYLAQMREALSAWANHVAFIASDDREATNVFSLTARK